MSSTRRIGLLAVFVFVAVSVPVTVAAAPAGKGSNTAQGTKLVTRFFDLLTDGDVAGMKKLLSPAFQLQGADGGFLDKQEFIADPPDVESYELSNLKATRTGKVLVVRY